MCMLGALVGCCRRIYTLRLLSAQVQESMFRMTRFRRLAVGSDASNFAPSVFGWHPSTIRQPSDDSVPSQSQDADATPLTTSRS
jgi:hypothetical protein